MRLPSPSLERPTLTMVPLRLAVVLLLTSAMVEAQTSLPPTAPTAIPSPVGTINATPVSRATRPAVTFANGMLDVRASNASLHQILRLISRQTGMRITGGVEDQRVFGNYGPAPAGTVLATLLGGTGINMFVREDGDHRPLELVMTPRSGGATPPAFQAQSQEDDVPEPAAAMQPASTQPTVTALSGAGTSQTSTATQTTIVPSPTTQPNAGRPPVAQGNSGPQSIPQPLNNVLGSPSNATPTASQLPTTNSVPLDSLATPSTTTQTAPGIVDSANPPPAGTQNTGTPTPATPEQIYQQLLKLQQQKAAPGTPAATPQ